MAISLFFANSSNDVYKTISPSNAQFDHFEGCSKLFTILCFVAAVNCSGVGLSAQPSACLITEKKSLGWIVCTIISLSDHWKKISMLGCLHNHQPVWSLKKNLYVGLSAQPLACLITEKNSLCSLDSDNYIGDSPADQSTEMQMQQPK